MATPYDLGVRKSLNNMGVDDSRIGFDETSGYVTVDGKNIIKPQSNLDGTTYTNQASLNSIAGNVNQMNNAYNLQQKVLNPQQQANPYDQQFSNLMATLTQRANNPAVIDRNAIYNSPQYAAQQAQANQQANKSIRSGQEALGTSGMARSSDLARFAQNAQNDANQFLETQIVPQLIAQEQARQQQQNNELANILGFIGQQQGVFDNRQNQQFNQAASVLEFIESQKNRQEDRSYQRERDTVGDQRYNQEFDYQVGRDQEADQRFDEEFAYRQARDQIADDQEKMKFDEDVRRFGLNYALQKADQANVFANRTEDNNRANEANQLARDRFEFEKKQDKTPASTVKVDPKESTDNYSLLVEDLNSEGVTKEVAFQLLQANRDSLTDADYRKLSDLINETF